VIAMMRFSDARTERPEIRDRFDLLLGVVATLEIVFRDRLLYREEEFPVVELRAHLARWLHDEMPRELDFEFQSMESDEAGLVWLRHVPEGWRIGSIQQEFPAIDPMSAGQVSELVNRFIEDVDQWVREQLNIEPATLIE
jgi:hypothetical protein